jgi:hypothetical protein
VSQYEFPVAQTQLSKEDKREFKALAFRTYQPSQTPQTQPLDTGTALTPPSLTPYTTDTDLTDTTVLKT